MKKIALEVPSWLNKTEAHDKFFRNLCNEALMKVEYYRSLMKPFERKYSTSFKEFQKKVESNDLIEWEAYFLAYFEWIEKYKELKNVCSNNRYS